MARANPPQIDFAEDSAKMLESTIVSNLEMTPEERIEAHENARQLASDLRAAGEVQRAAKSQDAS